VANALRKVSKVNLDKELTDNFQVLKPIPLVEGDLPKLSGTYKELAVENRFEELDDLEESLKPRRTFKTDKKARIEQSLLDINIARGRLEAKGSKAKEEAKEDKGGKFKLEDAPKKGEEGEEVEEE
jgi:hypothetical protein